MSFLPYDFTFDSSDCEMDTIQSMENDLPTFSQECEDDSFISSHDEIKSPFLTEESIDFCDGPITIPECSMEAIDPSPKRAPFKNLSLNRNVPMTPGPITPEKPSDLFDGPLTPTANLKVLMSAASPEIRNRDSNKKKELFLQQDFYENESTCSAVEEYQENIQNTFGYEFEVSAKCDAPVSRKDKSLGLLCLKFLDRFPEYPSPTEKIELSLDEVAKDLAVERRRIYDIVNVLESVELVSRVAKNRYAWHGKRNLPNTLARLKALGETEGYAEKIREMKEFELSEEMNSFQKKGKLAKIKKKSPPSPDTSLIPSSGDLNYQTNMALLAAKAVMRKDKSLGIMSQKFLMLFLVSEPKILNLELAAKILIGGPNVDKTGSAQFKTKIRRLYDIANVLTSLNLIQKVHVTESRGRKPAFEYTGPPLDDTKPASTLSAAGLPLPSTRHSMLDYAQSTTSCVQDSRKEVEAATEVLVAAEKQFETEAPAKGKTTKKKSFSRHASFDLICRAAEEERTKLYSSLPPSPVSSQSGDSPTERPRTTNRPPPKVHTILPPAGGKKSTTFIIIKSEQAKKIQAKNSKNSVIFQITNPNGNKTKQPTVIPLTKDQISDVLKSLNVTTPKGIDSKYVDAATQFSPQQSTILPATLGQPVKCITIGKPVPSGNRVPASGDTCKRSLGEVYEGGSPLELCSKKVRVEAETGLEEKVICEPVMSPTIVVQSPDVDVISVGETVEGDSAYGIDASDSSEVAAEDLTSGNDGEKWSSDVDSPVIDVATTDLSESVSDVADVVDGTDLRISPDMTDNSNSQDAEVARINMPVLEKARLLSKSRPSPLRVLHLEPEFRASPSIQSLPRLPSESPSPQLPHRVTRAELDLASPLLDPQNIKQEKTEPPMNVPFLPEIANVKQEKPELSVSNEFQTIPVISEEKPRLGAMATIPAIPRSLYNDIVMPQPLSPSNFTMSPKGSRSNSVFSFASSTVNTPDLMVQKSAQACVGSPVVIEECGTILPSGLAQVAPVVPIMAMTPKTIMPSSIQAPYSTPIQSLALANSMNMTLHGNMTGAISQGQHLAFTPLTALATPRTFFHSTPGSFLPVNITPSEKLSEGISATLPSGEGYLLPFKKDFIPVRRLTMPPHSSS